MAGRTTLLIAHRRSTLQLADRIAVLDQGRLVDEGTHAELEARCPLYRELITGPDDDAEGTDAGELATTSSAGPREAAAGREPGLRPRDPGACGRRPGTADGPGGSGRAAGLRRSCPARQARSAARAPPRAGPGPRRRGGGMMAGIPPSPELLAKVDALPPAGSARRETGGGPRCRPPVQAAQVLRPFAVGLIIGLVLDALDALASLAMPALVRGGIDHGVVAKEFSRRRAR